MNARGPSSRQKFQTGLEAPPRNASYPRCGLSEAPSLLGLRPDAPACASSTPRLRTSALIAQARSLLSSDPGRRRVATWCGLEAEAPRGVSGSCWVPPAWFPGRQPTSRFPCRDPRPSLGWLSFCIYKGNGQLCFLPLRCSPKRRSLGGWTGSLCSLQGSVAVEALGVYCTLLIPAVPCNAAIGLPSPHSSPHHTHTLYPLKNEPENSASSKKPPSSRSQLLRRQPFPVFGFET